MFVKNGNKAEKIIINIIKSQDKKIQLKLLQHNKTKGIDLVYLFGNSILNIEVKSAIRVKRSLVNSHFFIHLSQIKKNHIFGFVIYDKNGFLYHLFAKSQDLFNIPNKNYINKFLISEKQLKLYCKPKSNILDIIAILDRK